MMRYSLILGATFASAQHERTKKDGSLTTEVEHSSKVGGDGGGSNSSSGGGPHAVVNGRAFDKNASSFTQTLLGNRQGQTLVQNFSAKSFDRQGRALIQNFSAKSFEVGQDPHEQTKQPFSRQTSLSPNSNSTGGASVHNLSGHFKQDFMQNAAGTKDHTVKPNDVQHERTKQEGSPETSLSSNNSSPGNGPTIHGGSPWGPNRHVQQKPIGDVHIHVGEDDSKSVNGRGTSVHDPLEEYYYDSEPHTPGAAGPTAEDSLAQRGASSAVVQAERGASSAVVPSRETTAAQTDVASHSGGDGHEASSTKSTETESASRSVATVNTVHETEIKVSEGAVETILAADRPLGRGSEHVDSRAADSSSTSATIRAVSNTDPQEEERLRRAAEQEQKRMEDAKAERLRLEAVEKLRLLAERKKLADERNHLAEKERLQVEADRLKVKREGLEEKEMELKNSQEVLDQEMVRLAKDKEATAAKLLAQEQMLKEATEGNAVQQSDETETTGLALEEQKRRAELKSLEDKQKAQEAEQQLLEGRQGVLNMEKSQTAAELAVTTKAEQQVARQMESKKDDIPGGATVPHVAFAAVVASAAASLAAW